MGEAPQKICKIKFILLEKWRKLLHAEDFITFTDTYSDK